ncbi:MAG: EamA family transporter [Ruminococcaceae bacterium]|nr:EamA family transporter [Oscillospiraceae bacterium]
MDSDVKSYRRNTIGGFICILIWATSVAFGRTLTESLGIYTSNALICILGGLIGLVFQIKNKGIIAIFKDTPNMYWALCMPLYVIYRISTNIALGIATTREQVVTSGLIRMMWPLLTLVIAVIMFKDENKAQPMFLFGVLLCIVGVIVCNGSAGNFTVRGIISNFKDAAWPSVFSTVSAVSWALYSNIFRLVSKDKEFDSISIPFLVTGVISLVISFFVDEPKQFNIKQAFELFYSVVFVTFVATLLWNNAMQKGNHMLIIYASNFLPAVTTIFSALMLGVKLTAPMIVGSLLVVFGIIVSKRYIKTVDKQGISEEAGAVDEV